MFTLTSFALLVAFSNGFTNLTVSVDGVNKTLYVNYDYYTNATTLKMPSSSGTYLSTTPYIDVNTYFKPNLLGGSVEYDVNLSTRNCGCVAAFYLVKSPGKDANGNLWATDNTYYCDANAYKGNYCPEFDIMEANIWSFMSSPHACPPPTANGFYSSCDGVGGCGQNSVKKLAYYDYGFGTNFKINTQNEFHVKLDFGASTTSFGNFTTIISQGLNTIQM